MSTLIIDPLFDGVTFTQPIKVSRNISIAHIRPWVYLNGTLQDGNLQCRVLQGVNVLTTVSIPYTEVNTAKTLNYAHGYIRFDFESLILFRNEGEEKTEYIFEFSMVDHTSDPNNYIAICREWDNKSAIVYGEVDINGEAVNDYVEPAGYEIFEYRS